MLRIFYTELYRQQYSIIGVHKRSTEWTVCTFMYFLRALAIQVMLHVVIFLRSIFIKEANLIEMLQNHQQP
jgi:hypothetical protein